MSTLVIEGGRRVEGRVDVEGNKNAALPLMAACLLTDEWCTLHRVIGRGFTPGRDVDVRCWRSDGGEWTQVGESTTVTISADGTAAVDTCLAPMSLTGEHAYRVSFDDVSSNAVDG